MDFDVLLGQTITSFENVNNEEIFISTKEGNNYKLYHSQDCCESVSVEDIAGDISDILDSPVLLAEEISSDKNPKGIVKEYQDSFTWTYYKISTIKGSISIRWYGESNGYYSESVEFVKL